MKLNPMLTIDKNGLKYYESDLKQKDQKYMGWYWCSERKAFYRWDGVQDREEATV